jgi:uncharacterized protein YrrD
MLNVELKEGTSVETSDGRELGRINRFVLNPETNEVTHIVVQKGWLLPEDKVIPFDRVRSATDERVVLTENVLDFDELPPFEESHYVQANDNRDLEGRDTDRADTQPVIPATAGYYWYPPQGYLGYPAYGLGEYAWPRTETVQNIPADTVPLKEGTNVISADGEHIGDVERLFIDTNSNRATHFVISQGTFFKDRKLVPANWVRSVTEDEVQLYMSSDLLERLPAYEPE